MDISVIIVNYNVKYFVEQCLHSVLKAQKHLKVEVFVVDNNSTDGSCNMLRAKFPEIALIENKENLGFSKANNQAIRLASGKYILLLNPDTVIEEETLLRCFEFMETHPDAGGLGVKMIDGKGHFLPESKRGLPTPSAAFYKIFGLSRIFPHSARFNRYHLGYLSKDATHEIEILAGAFMFMRHETLEKTGLLDEDFFMYGEDIDLSYRITQAGYKNYYYPGTTIIHYKGESTKKGSINYVLVFYRAMIIFARKHFSSRHARLLTTLINIAIYLRAGASVARRIFDRVAVPVLDFAAIAAGLYFIIQPVWSYIKHGIISFYPDDLVVWIIPLYVSVWIFMIFFFGGYEKPLLPRRIIRGILTGTIVILVFYALLPENARFSRAFILLGTAWAMVAGLSIRLVLYFLNLPSFRVQIGRQTIRNILAGNCSEIKETLEIMKNSEVQVETIGIVSDEDCPGLADRLGNLRQLEEIVRTNKINEIVFCGKDIPSKTIIGYMLKLSAYNVNYKIKPPEGESIIGSNSIDTAGDFYVVNLNTIAQERNRRQKRMFDIALSMGIIVFWPFMWLVVKKPFHLMVNAWRVLFGYYTWVSYYRSGEVSTFDLPPLKKGIVSPAGKNPPGTEACHRLNFNYARNYEVWKDVRIVFENFRELGN